MPWIDACTAAGIEEEGAKRFGHNGRTFAIYRNHQHECFCTDGLVTENMIECPKHSSIFDFTTGEAEMLPACKNLHTYPAKVENGRVLIEV